ncbi:MAG: hypothetical protein DMG65_17560 [Candidatus Angelobacter sp. Gp1-AA117]|nr:MAG: hypothetical protein DMG65_17560 [Candidatus Angelobacter sp. Gp1-AA117]
MKARLLLFIYSFTKLLIYQFLPHLLLYQFFTSFLPKVYSHPLLIMFRYQHAVKELEFKTQLSTALEKIHHQQVFRP